MDNQSKNRPELGVSDDVLARFAEEGEKAARAKKAVPQGAHQNSARKPAQQTRPTPPIKSVNPVANGKNSRSNGKQEKPLPEKKQLAPDEARAMEMRRKIAFWVIIGITALILLFFVIYVAFFKKDGKPQPDTSRVQGVEIYDPSKALSHLTYNLPENFEYPAGIQEKYKALYAANQDFVGWLSVPNTSIDTAVYQADDNDYYLKKDLWGRYSRYGTVFMDYCDDIADMRRNTVIYGHNFDDDGNDSYDDYIFGDVHKYLDVEFYKTAPVIEFNTLYRDYKWKVIGCFYTNGDSSGDNDYLFYYIATSMNDANFTEYVKEMQERSYIHTGVDVQPTDKILTLSTCTYFFDRGGRLENARCVLVARMVRDGEDESVDVSAATQNENPRYPQMYYDIFGGENPYRNADKWTPAE